MKTEDVRATEIALTPYVTLILFSIPGISNTDDEIASSFADSAPTLAGACDAPQWRFPSLAESPERRPVHL